MYPVPAPRGTNGVSCSTQACTTAATWLVSAGRTTADFAQALLDDSRVALTPGEAFDAPGFVRISYAASLGELQRGAERILQFVRSVEHRGRAAAGA